MDSIFKLDNMLCFALYETSSRLTKLYTKALKPYNLTYPQYLVLRALWEQDGLSVKELGELLGMGTGTLTPVLQRMEQHSWLHKARNTEDERKVHIFLEAKAIEKEQEITAIIFNNVLNCGFEEEQYIHLLSELKKFNHVLKQL